MYALRLGVDFFGHRFRIFSVAFTSIYNFIFRILSNRCASFVMFFSNKPRQQQPPSSPRISPPLKKALFTGSSSSPFKAGDWIGGSHTFLPGTSNEQQGWGHEASAVISQL